MTLWWPAAILTGQYASQPWSTWFYDYIIGTAWGWPGYTFASMPEHRVYYYFYKIPASNGHKVQLAIKSPENRTLTLGSATYTVKKNVIYICCYDGDTPNWGGVSNFISISPPCSNWYTDLYTVSAAVTRSQTLALLAAVKGTSQKSLKIKAAAAKTDELEFSVDTVIQADRSLDLGLDAAIQGEVEKPWKLRSAIRGERVLEPAIVAAAAKTDELEFKTTATIQGNPQKDARLRTAILGDSEKSFGLIAYVVKTRVDKIMLEMENLWPQELDLRSTPNWASKIKDYRKDSLGE